MADGFAVTPGSGGTVATDDAGAAGHVQIVKLAVSTDGSATVLTADNTGGLRISPSAVAVPVTGAGTSTIGTTSVEIVAANTARREATVCNDHASNIVYLALGGDAFVGRGVRLNAQGGTYTTPPGYTGSIEVIATAASTVVTFVEV